MATITYAQHAPQSLLRDLALDPLPSLAAQGLGWSQIYGMPALSTQGVARGRMIDMSGAPLHGKLLVRNKRNLLGTFEGDAIAQTIGDARETLDIYAPTEKAFTQKQFSGYAKQPLHYIENGTLPSELEEAYLVQQSASAVHRKLELYTSSFFTTIAGDGAVNGQSAAGWGAELDWQDAGTVGGTDLDSSENAMDVLHAVIQAARLRGSGRVNALYGSRQVFEKLAREPSILGRVIVKSGGAADGSVAAFQGQRAAPMSFVVEVLKQHLELDEIVICGATKQYNAGVSRIWPDGRIWVGSTGDTAISFGRNASPKVLSGAGSFCGVMGKLDVSVGPSTESNMPQNFEAITEMFFENVALDTSGGTVVYNMG